MISFLMHRIGRFVVICFVIFVRGQFLVCESHFPTGRLASSVDGEVSAWGCNFSVFEFVICSAIAIFMLLCICCGLRPLWCKFLILEVRVIGAVGVLWW